SRTSSSATSASVARSAPCSSCLGSKASLRLRGRRWLDGAATRRDTTSRRKRADCTPFRSVFPRWRVTMIMACLSAASWSTMLWSPGCVLRPRSGTTGRPRPRDNMTTIATDARPSFGEAFLLWFKIGWIKFCGPAGQLALMHRTLVDEKKWVDEARFLHALNFCMLLPGPEAQKLATYLGWLLHGLRGGLSAGILFVLPGAFVMLGLSLLYALGRGISLIDGALFGIKAAVLVIV